MGFLVWCLATLVAGIQYYSPQANEAMTKNAITLIVQVIVGAGMTFALRSDHGDWENVRRNLPDRLRESFDRCIDTATNVQGDDYVPVSINNANGTTQTILVHRDNLRDFIPTPPAREPL